MRILLAHNFYGSALPSGENQVFKIEREMLRSRGHEVEDFVRHSDEIKGKGAWGLVRGALSTPWNPWAAAGIQRKVEKFRPDVVHVHNTFPLLSPAIFQAIGNRAARVLTLHNYRLFCPAAIPMRRDGTICTRCLDQHSVLPSIQYGCYRGSRVANMPLAASVALHQFLGTWDRQVDAFIALTDFQRELMVKAGLPSDRVFVKPNFFPGNPVTVEWGRRNNVVVFAGRLSSEKGVGTLIKAWAQWGTEAPELRIIGDGSLRGKLEMLARGARVNFLGQVPSTQAQSEISHAKLLILPSECFECFPMVIREAFAFGTPAAVTNVGPLPSIVQHHKNGVVFNAGDPSSLLHVVSEVWQTPGKMQEMGAKARLTYETHYTEDINYQLLMAIYDQALDKIKAYRLSL